MSEQIFSEINANLKVLIRLKALDLIGGRPQREQIAVLSQGGFSPKQIAELLGTSSNTVSVELSRARRDNKKIGRTAK